MSIKVVLLIIVATYMFLAFINIMSDECEDRNIYLIKDSSCLILER
jgi:hypothetical protein